MKINGFAYDSENQTYCRTETNSEQNADGTTSTKTVKLPIDEELNEKIKKLAEISKKGEKFNLEQLKFLYIHRNDSDVAPELAQFNREYLNNLREAIAENRRAELIAAQEVTNRWSSILNESHDPFTAFLFSFMTAYSKHKEDLVREATKLDFAITNEENKTQNEAIAKFLNALDYKEGDVKIIHIEKDDLEQIKVIKNKEEWSKLANDEAFKSLITDEKSQTSIYSATAEKFKDFEEKLASAENKKSVLNENLGTPDAQKTYGESTKEGVEFSQKMRQDASSEESKASEQKKEHTESKSAEEGEKEKRTSKKTKLPIEEMLAQKDTIKVPQNELSIEGETEKQKKQRIEDEEKYSIPRIANFAETNEKKLKELSNKLEHIENGETGENQKKELSEVKEEINKLFKNITKQIEVQGLGEAGAWGLFGQMRDTLKKMEKAEDIERKLTPGGDSKVFAKDEVKLKWDIYLNMLQQNGDNDRDLEAKKDVLTKEEYSQKRKELKALSDRSDEFYKEHIEKRENTSQEKGELYYLELNLSTLYSQNVTQLKESGDFEKLLKGEKIKIYTPDKAISCELALVEMGKGASFHIMSGNLQIYDMDKLSERQKELVEPASRLHLMPYMNEKEKIEWLTISEENIPSQIGGHSVTNEEKKALMKGEVIVLTDCTENSPNQKPYTAEVHATLKKSANGDIKPVMSVNPKWYTEKQSLGEKQKQEQKQVKTQKQKIKI